MGIKLIFIGLLFMLNPVLQILDFLPDFIGCAIIIYGLIKISSISPSLNDAKNYFRYLLYISVARTIIFFASGKFDGVMILSISLIFAALEFGFSIMAFNSLTDGFDYLAVRFGAENVKDFTPIANVGKIYFAARGLMSILPKISTVMTDKNDDITAGDTVSKWDAYEGLLQVSSAVISLIFAGFFFYALYTCIWKLSQDTEFIEALSNEYSNKQANCPGFFTRRTLVLGLSLMSAGGFALFDLIGNGINIIPDFIFAVCAVCAVYVLRNHLHNTKKLFISACLYLTASVANFTYYTIFMKNRFFASFDYIIFNFLFEYIFLILFALLECISLIYFAKCLLPSFTPILKNEIIQDVPDDFLRTALKNDIFVRKSFTLLKVYCVMLCVVGVSGVLFSALIQPFPIYYMIHMTLNAVFFCISLTLFSRLISGVRQKYERAEEY